MPTIPDALAMRNLKYGDAPAAERDRVAGVLRSAGRRTEALLLYEGRSQHESLVSLRDHAITHGLAFPLLALRRMGGEVTEAHLRGAAEAAEKGGRWLEARQLRLALGDTAALERLAPHLPESLRPPPAAPAPASAPTPAP